MFRRAERILALGSTVAAGAATPAEAQGTTERVSVRTGGGQSNDDSTSAALSALTHRAGVPSFQGHGPT